MKEEVRVPSKHPIYVDLSEYDRIRNYSPEILNQQIMRQIQDNVRHFAQQDSFHLSQRIRNLEEEWDIDRALMASFAGLGSLSFLLGYAGSRKWHGLLVAQFGFLMLHAIRGWCPPASVLRRLGFRSRMEIDAERYALKTARGDFERQAA